jgi:uncharacterized membrane protein YfcA
MGMDSLVLIAYFLLGLFAGTIGGLMGLGGGIIIVPALHYIFIGQGFPSGIIMHLAVATSLATIVFTALAATWTHHRKDAVLWPTVGLLVPGIFMGGVAGAVIANYLPSNTLRIGFGVFELLVAIQIASDIKPSPHRNLPTAGGTVSTGGGIGMMSTLLGIGGGTMTVPFLLWCNVNMRNAVATSSACGLPIAFAGATSMIVTGWDNAALPADSLGYVYWPAALVIIAATVIAAPFGAKLAHLLPIITLKRLFAVLVAAVGIRMLF